MSRLAAGLLALLLAAPEPRPPQNAGAVAGDLAAGIALVKEGDFEGAVLKLDGAVQVLEADPRAQADLATAYLYLGVAYLELDQELSARARFRLALGRDPAMRLDPRQFSPQVIRVFEAVRAEAPPALPGPSPSPPPAAAVPPRQVPAPPPAEEKKSRKGLVFLVGAGAAAASVALAVSGGGGAEAPPTTGAPATTAPVGGTTPTTVPPTTAPPATTMPPPPTTVPPPICTYDINNTIRLGLGAATNQRCPVRTNLQSCSWTAQASNPAMVTITQGSGTGNGDVVFDVSFTLLPRTSQVTLAQGGGACTVEQVLLPDAPPRRTVWTAELQGEGVVGQLVVNGQLAAYQEQGTAQGLLPPGPVRVEATLVGGLGKPGAWRFSVTPEASGSLRVIAGDVLLLTEDTVAFRLAGKPGERLVFEFQSP